MIRCTFTPQQVRQAYRRRFGKVALRGAIESSYRCARHARGWTTSPNPAIRFVLMALSFFLVNVWVAFRKWPSEGPWLFAQKVALRGAIPRRGGRLVAYTHFRLQRLIDWKVALRGAIVRVIDRIYHPISAIHALASPID